VRTRDGTYDYKVMFSHAVSPSDVAVLDPTTDNRLTLTTCTPRFTATQRLVVVSKLAGPVDPRPVRLVPPAASPTTIPGDATATTTSPPPTPQLAGADIGSLSGQGTTTAPAIVWGIVCALLWFGAWLASRRVGRWIAYGVGTPVFLLCLYFFFENFARFVPANL